MGTRTRPTLYDRGYFYASKRTPSVPTVTMTGGENRAAHAVTWRAGFLAAQVEARRRAKAQKHKS